MNGLEGARRREAVEYERACCTPHVACCIVCSNSYEWLGYPLRRLPNDVWVIQELLTAYQPQVSARCTTYCAHHAPPSHDTVPLSTLEYPNGLGRPFAADH